MADDPTRSTPGSSPGRAAEAAGRDGAGDGAKPGADRADEIVLSLYAKGLITAEISAHFCCLCRSRAAASASESGCSA